MGKVTYAAAGVDRSTRAEAKKAFDKFGGTYSLSKYGPPVRTPFNTLYPIEGKYHVKTCDGIGTKVLLAELAGKHDTIGVDAIAMVVNDAIRCGAEPLALTDVIDVSKSEPKLLAALQKGLDAGAREANCPIVGGETADVPELVRARYHINCDCVGEVERNNIVDGRGIVPGDKIVGIRSAGLHSNGISLARRVLFKEWGGKYDAHDAPGGIGRDLVLEALEPTRIYVKPVLHAMRDFDVKAAVHITGDAYLKFGRLFRYSPKIGFSFDYFKPQPIFDLIGKSVAMPEMFKTFNMGWGFALVVPKGDADGVVQHFGDAAVIGEATAKVGSIVVSHAGKRMVL